MGCLPWQEDGYFYQQDAVVFLSECFLLSYAIQAGALLIVGWQKEVLYAELARHDLDVLLPADISAEVRHVHCGDVRCTGSAIICQAGHGSPCCARSTEDSRFTLILCTKVLKAQVALLMLLISRHHQCRVRAV